MRVTFSVKPEVVQHGRVHSFVTTTCLVCADGEHSLRVGQSYCSARDVYDHNIGCRVALERAVMGLPKDVRSAAWNEARVAAGLHGPFLAKKALRAYHLKRAAGELL